MNNEKVKEVLEEVTAVVIESVKDQDLTGEEKEAKVCAFIATLDNNVPGLCLLPDELEAKILDAGIDKIQELVKEIDVIDFVKSTYQKVKHLFKKD